MAIPHIIHQTWRVPALPRRFARWSETWRRHHPDWHYRLYTDEDIERTIAQRAPEWLPTFRSFARPVQRVDFFRYLIVYLDGGLYADLDMIAYKSSEPLLQDQSCVLAVEHELTQKQQSDLGFRLPFQLANCIFAAAPKHPFLLALLETIGSQAATPIRQDQDVLHATGPYFLTRVAFDLTRERKRGIKVLPQLVWMAPWHYPRIGPVRTNMYARHVGAGTWRTGSAIGTWADHLREWYGRPSALRGTAPEL